MEGISTIKYLDNRDYRPLSYAATGGYREAA
jgi:hypothetical protein